jgi:hypothetical protein
MTYILALPIVGNSKPSLHRVSTINLRVSAITDIFSSVDIFSPVDILAVESALANSFDLPPTGPGHFIIAEQPSISCKDIVQVGVVKRCTLARPPLLQSEQDDAGGVRWWSMEGGKEVEAKQARIYFAISG